MRLRTCIWCSKRRRLLTCGKVARRIRVIDRLLILAFGCAYGTKKEVTN